MSYFRSFLAFTMFLLLAALPAYSQNYASGRVLEGKELERSADRFFKAIHDSTWRIIRDEYELTDEMREWVDRTQPNDWNYQFVFSNGRLYDLQESRTVQDAGGSHSVELYYPGERYPMMVTVTYDGAKVAAIKWEKWKGGPWPLWKKLFVGYCAALLPLAILIIWLGEKWRMHYIQRRNLRQIADDWEVPEEKAYREKQSPLWGLVLATLLGTPFLALAFLAAERYMDLPQELWLGFFALPGVWLLLAGFRTRVNRRDVVVCMGWLRIPVCRIPLEKIEDVSIMTFRPFREFGGWGIRRSKDGIRGYFMSGTPGVLVETIDGRRTLIGSDTPERLAEVIATRAKISTPAPQRPKNIFGE